MIFSVIGIVRYFVNININIGDIKAAHEYLILRPPIANIANPVQTTISKKIFGCLEYVHN